MTAAVAARYKKISPKLGREAWRLWGIPTQPLLLAMIAITIVPENAPAIGMDVLRPSNNPTTTNADG